MPTNQTKLSKVEVLGFINSFLDNYGDYVDDDPYLPRPSHMTDGPVLDVLFKKLDKSQTGRVDRLDMVKYLLGLAGKEEAEEVTEEDMKRRAPQQPEAPALNSEEAPLRGVVATGGQYAINSELPDITDQKARIASQVEASRQAQAQTSPAAIRKNTVVDDDMPPRPQ